MMFFVALANSAEQPNWKQDWTGVIEAAKQEGQLSLYGGQEITHPDIIAGFNKDFPFIKVSSASGRAADMMTRIVAERRADSYLADIHSSRGERSEQVVQREALVCRSGKQIYFYVRRHHREHRAFRQYQAR